MPAGIRCIFFDTEIPARKCLDMQLTGKAICKTCDDGQAVKETLEKIKENIKATKKKEKKKMLERDYKEHQKCSVEGCEKYAVKDGMCVAHYKEKHGESPYGSKNKVSKGQSVKGSEKRKYTKHKNKDVPQASATLHQQGLLDRLMELRDEKHQEYLKLEDAVKVIQRYAI